jgi:chemotaxis response regulator CheB
LPIATAQLSNLLAQTTHKVLAIDASMGGTKAIEMVLSSMPAIIDALKNEQDDNPPQ